MSKEPTIVRNCLDMDQPERHGGGKVWRPHASVRFHTDDISRGQAQAHLELGQGSNHIVLCGKRGTRGGWIGLRVVSNPDQLIFTKHATYHLVVEKHAVKLSSGKVPDLLHWSGEVGRFEGMRIITTGTTS